MVIQDELNRGLTSFGSRLNQLAVEQRVAAAKGDLTDGRLDHGKHQKPWILRSPKMFFCW